VSAAGSRSYAIGVIRGDGIGPEVVAQGLKVLERVASVTGFGYHLEEYPWNSQLYLDKRQLMPESALEEYRQLDALFLGALGDPRVERGLVERSVIMTLRLGLDLYINLRPVVLYDDRLCPIKNKTQADIDMIVIRENTEDAYVGVGGVMRQGTEDEIAIAEMIYTRKGVERCIRYAFDTAVARARAMRVTLVDKANAIRAQEIWRRVLADVARDFPGIETEAIYVDAAAMYMISDPARFDVMVTTNLFGDILTDLGAVIQGGMGSAASGNIHPGRTSLFEPIHGSAPDIAGKNIASPVGAITAVALMLDHLGEPVGSGLIDRAVRELIVSEQIPSLDAKSGVSTERIGDLVAAQVGVEAARIPHA
jgi:3-isopropylmalate dehydrogenase